MKTFKGLIFSFLLISIPLSAKANSVNPWAVPAGLYLKGIGPIYGVGAGLSNLTGEQGNLTAFKTFEDVDVYGFLISDIPLGINGLSLNVGYAKADKFELETNYARALNESTIFKQELKGEGNLFSLNYALFNKKLNLNYTLINSHVEFVDYRTKDGDLIPFSKAALHDINSDISSFSISTTAFKDDHNQIDLKGSITSTKGRLAQSDIRNYHYQAKYKRSLSPSIDVALYTHLNHVSITKASNSAAVNGNCSQNINNPYIYSQCLELQEDVTEFIDQSNKYGTATPLGGSTGLRSYREFRFRSANNALSSAELRYNFNYHLPLQAVSFFELGHANDQLSQLYKKSVYSAGLGLRAFVKDIPLRLEAATGNEGESVFLTAGLPF